MKIPLHTVFTKSVRSLFYPEVLKMLLLPLIGSIFLVCLSFYLTWDLWLSLLASGFSGFEQWVVLQAGDWGTTVQKGLSVLGWLGPLFLIILMFLMAMPLTLALNMIVISILASTKLVRIIQEKEYPHVQWKGQARFTKGVLNSLLAGLVFLGVWILTLPLWLIPGFGIAVPVVLNAWMNRQVCLFDASTDVADDGEFHNLKKTLSGSGFLLGLMMAGINYIPLAFLITPVLTMLGYIHLVFMSLEKNRS